MRRYILYLISLVSALFLSTTVWGQTAQGTLPEPDERNEDLSTGIYTLTKDYKPSYDRRWRVSGGRNVIVDLNGHTIDGVNIGRTIFNISDGTLTIKDSKGGGKIINSTKSCVYVSPSSGKSSICNFEGGTIENCKPSDGNGGAFDIRLRGTVNMSGGTITKCLGENGAAIYVKSGIFNMSGGIIKENRVNAYKNWNPPTGNDDIPTCTSVPSNATRGGGVYVENNGTFKMTGGTISGNIANSGGGVFVTKGSNFTFTGGTIDGNYAVATLGANVGNGGGIYIENSSGSSSCTIQGGVLKNNKATRYGGAININGGTVNVLSSSITNNVASSGGGIAMEVSGSILNLNGNCTIDNNIAKVSGHDPNGTNGGGGGVFINNGNINISNTSNSITSNRSYVLGGGIFVKNGNITVNVGGTLNVGGDTSADGNTAKNDGGGIYCAGTITVNGESTFGYNTAGSSGGAIYVTDGSLKTNGYISLKSNVAEKNNGGAVYVSNGDISTTTGDMSGNSAKLGKGGVFFVNSGNINLNGKTTMSDNTAKNGGAIALEGGVFNIHTESEISNNEASENGGGLWVNNTTGAAISCKGGSFSNNTAVGNGGGIYATGDAVNNLKFVFAANVKNNTAQKNGGGIYTDGVEMYFGNGLIVANKAGSNDVQTFASTGIIGTGGGIYMTNGTLKFTDASVEGGTVKPSNEALENLGIYNNDASYEAADIYVSGVNTTIHLPYVKGMNLSGFDVPGSELYWVRDHNEWIDNGITYPRYQKALLDMNVDIEKMIVGFTKDEMADKLKTITDEICLDLGYDLVFVTFTAKGLDEVDNAELQILYPKLGDKDNNILYRKILFSGSDDTKTVGLPSGNWRFKSTDLSYKYSEPTFNPSYAESDNSDTGELAGYVLFKRNQRDEMEVKYEPLTTGEGQVIEYDMKVMNKMIPKKGGEVQIIKPKQTAL